MSAEPAVVYVPAPPPPYSLKKSAAKAGKAIALQALAVVVIALGGWLVDGTAVTAALKDIPGGLYLVPVLSGLGHSLLNWQKHKGQ